MVDLIHMTHVQHMSSDRDRDFYRRHLFLGHLRPWPCRIDLLIANRKQMMQDFLCKK